MVTRPDMYFESKSPRQTETVPRAHTTRSAVTAARGGISQACHGISDEPSSMGPQRFHIDPVRAPVEQSGFSRSTRLHSTCELPQHPATSTAGWTRGFNLAAITVCLLSWGQLLRIELPH